MKKLVLIVFLLLMSCAKHSTDNYTEEFYIPAYGSASTVELAAWNIENFPRTSDTDSVVADIIKALEIDFFGIEEVMDEDAFNELLARLPGYAGRSSHSLPGFDAYGDMGLGFIYNTSVINIHSFELLFTDDNYAFPRAPLKVHFTYQNESGEINLIAIILHLKAMGSGDTDELRRESAMNQLKEYIDSVPASAEKDFVLLGDWNSDYTQEDYLLTIFNQEENYHLLTYDFYESTEKYEHNATYPSYSSVIDHIVITTSLETQIEIESVKTLRIDDYYKRYTDLVSDHRPVAFKFAIK